MGFGHRVYKNYDPRAKVIKKLADEVFDAVGKNPLIDIARRARADRARGRVLRQAQALPERRLLLGPHLPGDGPPDGHVPGALRDRPHARLARAVGGDARRRRSRRSRARARSTSARTSATTSRSTTADRAHARVLEGLGGHPPGPSSFRRRGVARRGSAGVFGSVVPFARVLAAGSVIAGKYRLDSPIGKGGMGAVWRATHLALGRPVAVKFVLASLDDAHGASAESLARFLREARSAAAVRHRNVVDVLDFGDHEGRPFLVMECLEGESLAQRLERAPPPSLGDIVGVDRGRARWAGRDPRRGARPPRSQAREPVPRARRRRSRSRRCSTSGSRGRPGRARAGRSRTRCRRSGRRTTCRPSRSAPRRASTRAATSTRWA